MRLREIGIRIARIFRRDFSGTPVVVHETVLERQQPDPNLVTWDHAVEGADRTYMVVTEGGKVTSATELFSSNIESLSKRGVIAKATKYTNLHKVMSIHNIPIGITTYAGIGAKFGTLYFFVGGYGRWEIENDLGRKITHGTRGKKYLTNLDECSGWLEKN